MDESVVSSLVLVSNGDDWEALYVNGKKVYSSHRVPIGVINKWSLQVEMPLIKRYTTKEYTERCYKEGDFADKLENVKCINDSVV